MVRVKTIEIITSNWDRSAERFVGFIDIMGFKDLVARNCPEIIYEMMRKIRNSTFSTIMTFGVNDPEEGNYESNIYITTYSDSIIVYSKDNSPESLNDFIATISSLTDDLFEHEIPHKGAIALGIMTLDFKNSIFFGQPLIDAYLLHDELVLYGIVVHATAHELFKNYEGEGLYEYNCPFKSGSATHLTILPHLFYITPIEERRYQMFCDSIRKLRSKTSGALRIYIDRTLQYFESAKTTLNSTK